MKMNLHHSVNALLKFAGRWSLAATVHLPETFTGPQSFFSPTNGQIAVAIFTLCCSLTYNSKYAKQLLSASGENAATVLKSFGSSYQSSGNTLHQLISIGISSGMVNETNWLCIQYVGSLLSHSNIGSPTMKTTLAHVIALALQRCQHVNNPNFNNHRINNMNVLFLLNALTSYLSAEGLNGYNQLYDKDVKNSINLVQAKQMARDFLSLPNENLNEDMRLMSLPELLKWIVDNNQHSNQDPIKVAICKCLGNLYDNCSDDASVVQHRKTISSPAASEDMLAILIDAKCTDTDATNGNGGSKLFIKAIAAVALWNLLHQSEKAKSIAKELTNSIQSNKFGNPKSPIDTNYVATNTNCSEVEEILVKAETMINLLIQ